MTDKTDLTDDVETAEEQAVRAEFWANHFAEEGYGDGPALLRAYAATLRWAGAMDEAIDDLAMQLACEHGDTDDAGTGYSFSMEQFDAFVRALQAALAHPASSGEASDGRFALDYWKAGAWSQLEPGLYRVEKPSTGTATLTRVPESEPASGEWVDALTMPEGYELEEHLPGIWQYTFDQDGEEMASATSWNHPSLAAIGAWQSYAEAHQSEPVRVEAARPMDTAPRDSTMLRLLVRFDEHPTEDAEEAWTIGHNSFDANGEDEWRIAGWCWSHDHFTEGKGTPIGWLPMNAVARGADGEVES